MALPPTKSVVVLMCSCCVAPSILSSSFSSHSPFRLFLLLIHTITSLSLSLFQQRVCRSPRMVSPVQFRPSWGFPGTSVSLSESLSFGCALFFWHHPWCMCRCVAVSTWETKSGVYKQRLPLQVVYLPACSCQCRPHPFSHLWLASSPFAAPFRFSMLSEQLWLYDNMLTGTIPTQLSSIPRLGKYMPMYGMDWDMPIAKTHAFYRTSSMHNQRHSQRLPVHVSSSSSSLYPSVFVLPPPPPLHRCIGALREQPRRNHAGLDLWEVPTQWIALIA